MRAPVNPSPATGAVIAAVRARVVVPGSDRYLAPDIAVATDLVRSGALVAATGAALPELS